MQLQRHVDRLREQLAVAAGTGGEEARALAEQLTLALEPAVRLLLLDVLAEAAGEVTRELAPSAVELRLRGGEPELVVTGTAGAERAEAAAGFAGTDPGAGVPPALPGAGEGSAARINLRLPEQLKARVELAADREGLSINAWLVRAVAAAVERGQVDAQRPRPNRPGGQRYSGWGR